MILEGGEENLYCSHQDYTVSWYQAETEIMNEDPPEDCSCFPTIVAGVIGANLTFFNFSASSSGQYSCRATSVTNVELVCSFNVSAGTKVHS